MAYDYEKSIRPGKLPHIWCPGCGHGIAMKGLIRAMDTCELDRTKTALVSGIGCASRLPGYMDACTLQPAAGAHGAGTGAGDDLVAPVAVDIAAGHDDAVTKGSVGEEAHPW